MTSIIVLEHVGQDIILILSLSKPKDFNICFPTFISSMGSSDNETLIVSPIPSANKDPIPIDDFIVPENKGPASVIPR